MATKSNQVVSRQRVPTPLKFANSAIKIPDFSKNTHHVSWKNHGIDTYIRAALFMYLFGQRTKEVK